MTRQESIEILEDIARNSRNAAARIAAIKQLEAMREVPDPDPLFAELDQLAVRPARRE